MNFAKNLLEKYGWKEGQGLGKSQDGMSVPLKANLKFDQAGLGHSKSDELNNHWWERVYNSAAQNVDVNKNHDNEVSMTLKDGKSIEITTKSYTVDKRMKKDAPYGSSFLKMATLTNTGTEEEHPQKSTAVTTTATPFAVITDEDLFLACNGRTAHKGARHGLSLKGKLNRIEEQEKELLTKLKSTSDSEQKNGNIFSDWINVQHRKTKKAKRNSVSSTPDTESIPSADILYQNEYVASSAKQRKKQKQLDRILSAAFDISFSDDPPPKKSLASKLKPKKSGKSANSSNRYSLLDISSTTIKKKKKKKPKTSGKRQKLKNIFFESEFEPSTVTTSEFSEVTVMPKVKKAKKKARKSKREHRLLDDDQDDLGCSFTTQQQMTDKSMEDFGLPTQFKSKKLKKLEKIKKKSKEKLEMKKLTDRLKFTMSLSKET